MTALLRTPLPGALAGLLAVATPVAAAWNSSPGVPVTPAAAERMPQLAVGDGAGGAFIVLGGGTGPGQAGVFVQHLLADGQRAAGWPAEGAAAAPVAVGSDPGCLPYALEQVSATPDGVGGVFVSWVSPPFDAGSGAPALRVQHIAASGVRAVGWPDSGLSVTTGAGQTDSALFPDGSGGVLAIWRDVRHLFPAGSTNDDPHIILQHVLANGSRAPAWLAIGRFIGANMPPVRETRLSAAFTAEPTGGAWAIVERASADTTVDPAGFIVMRVDVTGLMSDGWGEDGIMLPGPSADIGHPGTHGATLFTDGSGGAWVFVASGARGAVIAFHLFADGSPDPALPVAGLTLAAIPGEEVEPDGAGGFFVRLPTDSGALALRRLLPSGGADPAWSVPRKLCGGLDAILSPTADGVLGVGWLGLSATGCQTLDGDVLVGRLARDGTIPADWPTDGVLTHGIAAAVNASFTTSEVASVACADGTGGVIVAWRVLGGDAIAAPGEVRAKRFTPQGAVAGVEPGGAAPGRLRVRWTRGGGVLATMGAAAGVRVLEVCDVAGRRLATAEVAPGRTEVTLPETRELQPGLYFIRVRAPGGAERAKVLVTY